MSLHVDITDMYEEISEDIGEEYKDWKISVIAVEFSIDERVVRDAVATMGRRK